MFIVNAPVLTKHGHDSSEQRRLEALLQVEQLEWEKSKRSGLPDIRDILTFFSQFYLALERESERAAHFFPTETFFTTTLQIAGEHHQTLTTAISQWYVAAVTMHCETFF